MPKSLMSAVAAGPLFLALAAAPVAAQEAIATSATELDEIVVVGALTDVVVQRDEIELTQANDIGDIFRRTPSVAVGGSLGIAQKIYVRGLEDSLLNVTVDGAPQRGTLFHHIGRVSIEPELLETVELQTGAGEATAGFGAVGGAIRFRTVDPTDLLRDGRDFGGIAKAGWFSNDGEKYSLTGFGRLFGDVGLLASYVQVDREEMEDGDGRLLRGTAAEQRLGFLKLGGDLGGGHRFSLSHEMRDEEGEFGQRPNWPVLEGDRLFPGEAQRRTTVANYGYDAGLGWDIEATGYFTRTEFTQDRYDRWGLYGAEIETYGADLRGRFDVADHRLTAGIEHRRDEVVSQYLGDPAMWQPWAWDPAIGRFAEEGSLIGVYAQDHWRPTDRLLISLGARYDSYELDQVTYADGTDSDGFSFNGGLDYDLTPDLTFNIGYAEAFRGKEIGDAFTLETRPGRISLAPDLRPERVENFEIGLDWARDGWSASAVYYDMAIDDVILDQLGSGPAPQGSSYYENVGRYSSDGIELRAGYRSGPFAVDGFFNSYDSRLNGRRIEGYEQIALGNSMGDNWNLTASYDPSDRLGFQASVTRYDDLNDIEVLYREVELGFIDQTQFVDKPGYTVVDLFGRWSPFADRNIEVLAAVYNLFDETYRHHASVADYSAIPGYEIVQGVNEPGRNVRLTVAYRF
ncbi:TonB-dependent receptor domain-containing protein [Brevundimonas lutea]|uniref:TonB-dependent receptor domain-containing protein n=1 Tax=Brevundimonas lutea TaxID=2293980 RepID=UPI000F025D9F|nr:TonB-dependent receptor [Brevundimonas lutea]